MSAVKWFLIRITAAGALSLAGNALLSLRQEFETVDVFPQTFRYRLAGDFSQGGQPVDAPTVTITRVSPLRVMKRQVTAAEYAHCMKAGECKRTSSNSDPASDFPAVDVSWEDATAYAHWFSKQTGYAWRLPTDEEWAFFAGSRFHDDGLSVASSSDPSVRWLARYEKEVGRGQLDGRPQRIGAFGANEYGLLDLSGNVWEWTSTCFSRQALDTRGEPLTSANINCGVRVAEGQHRAYVTNFIRNASVGGCAAGTPPSNLGFRLVRHEAPANFPGLRQIAFKLSEWFCKNTGFQRLGCQA